MARPARKFILIPEHRPLHAMGECFGPKHGPLLEPCPTPIPVIGKLLKQKGDEALTIMEVLKNLDGTTTSPVRLTLENYTLSYEEILGGATMPTPTTLIKPEEPKSVGPVIVTAGEKQKVVELADEVKVSDDAAVAEPKETARDDKPMATVEDDVIPVNHGDTGATTEEEARETMDYATTGYIAPADENPAGEDEPTVTVTNEPDANADPYAGMTKAQRKAARRAAAAAGGIMGSAQTATITNASNTAKVYPGTPGVGGIVGSIDEEPQG